MAHKMSVLLVDDFQRSNSSLLRRRDVRCVIVVIWASILRAIQRDELVTCRGRVARSLNTLRVERVLERSVLPNKGTMESSKIRQDISRVRASQGFDQRRATAGMRIANSRIDVRKKVDAEMQGK